MDIQLNTNNFRASANGEFRIANSPNRIAQLYQDKKHYKKILKQYRSEINELQNKMYAHDRYGMLLIFQAMDAAGKDSTIQNVMSGINPHGVKVFAFKRPSDNELDHSFLWRTNQSMPARGKIHIFNRSYYEEVLVAKVHPEIVTQHQKIPEETLKNTDELWANRYAAIRNLEAYEHQNGIHVIKFFLNVSKEEQKQRFLSRIDEPHKNWKFSETDVKERGFWDDYMQAYESAINETTTENSPWYVIPADDKKNMRLIVCDILLEHMQRLDMAYPTLSDDQLRSLDNCRKQLMDE